MNPSARQFVVRGELSPDELHRWVADRWRVRDRTVEEIGRVYLDTFDWRLYRAGTVIYREQGAGREPVVLWLDRASGEVRARFASADDPVPAVAELIEPRVLLPRAEISLELSTTIVVNSDDKIVCRFVVERARIAGGELPLRIRVAGLRGYESWAAEIVDSMVEMPVEPVESSLLVAALAAEGVEPDDFRPKATVALAADDRADEALGRFLALQLDVARRTEQGVRDSTDPEFLHDFRVACRRTRSMVQRIRGVWPAADARELNRELRWLGQATGAVRDLDVYLLDVPRYRRELPDSMRADLDPLADFLRAEHATAQAALIAVLDSDRYRELLDRWQRLIDYRGEELAAAPVKKVADLQIWRIYRKVRRDGRAIVRGSPAEALHDLRKAAKQLRYLLEAFRSLYPKGSMRRLISELKKLQDILGSYQDYEVQATTLAAFGKRMLAEGFGGSDTLMAMGVLVGHLEERQQTVRGEFHDCFARFDRKENRKLAKKLFRATKEKR